MLEDVNNHFHYAGGSCAELRNEERALYPPWLFRVDKNHYYRIDPVLFALRSEKKANHMNPFIRHFLAISFLVFFCILFPCKADPIDLRGIVLNEQGEPIPGAIARLSIAGIADTADANGAIWLTNDPGAVRNESSGPRAVSFAFTAGQCIISIGAQPQRVCIDRFSANGRLRDRIIDQIMGPGMHAIAVPASQLAPHEIVFLRARIGTRIFQERAIIFGRQQAGNRPAFSPRFAKSCVSSILDTLAVTGSGLQDANICLTSYTDSLRRIYLPGSGYPRAILAGAGLTVRIYTPDTTDGYYRGTRFDWSGMVSRVDHAGHSFYAEWKTPHNPDNPEHAIGPAEEFDMTNPPGYSDASVGGTFLKIGVGHLRRSQSGNYFFNNAYTFVSHGTWTTVRGLDWITMEQQMPDLNGRSYRYQKTIRLSGTDTLSIEHQLINTGTVSISTELYCHNLTSIDNQSIGPGYKVTLGFTPTLSQQAGFSQYASLSGTTITMTQSPSANSSAWASLGGYSGSADLNRFTIENTTRAASIVAAGDQPLSKFEFYAVSSVICPEPYIRMNAAAGQTTSWRTVMKFLP